MAGVGVEAVADFGWAWARASLRRRRARLLRPVLVRRRGPRHASPPASRSTPGSARSASRSPPARGVHVWGPDFSGTARFSVGPVLGDGRPSAPAPSGPASSRTGPASSRSTSRTPATASPAASPRSPAAARCPAPPGAAGRRPPPDGTAERPFEVYAEFELTVTTSRPDQRLRTRAGRRRRRGRDPLRRRRRRARAEPDGRRWPRPRVSCCGSSGSTRTTTGGRTTPPTSASSPPTSPPPAPSPEGSRVATGSFPIGGLGASAEPTGSPRRRRARAGGRARPPATRSRSAAGCAAAVHPTPPAGGPARDDARPRWPTLVAVADAAPTTLFASAPQATWRRAGQPDRRSRAARRAAAPPRSAPSSRGSHGQRATVDPDAGLPQPPVA